MKQSAGILLYQVQHQQLHVLLLHPGGPFWARKDLGAWTIPKGEPDEGETLMDAARREFFEETGHAITGNLVALTPVKQKSGKLVHVWAAEGAMDVSAFKSNTFELEWPPRSGKRQLFPEADKAQWFDQEEALLKILPSQQGFIKELQTLIL